MKQTWPTSFRERQFSPESLCELHPNLKAELCVVLWFHRCLCSLTAVFDRALAITESFCWFPRQESAASARRGFTTAQCSAGYSRSSTEMRRSLWTTAWSSKSTSCWTERGWVVPQTQFWMHTKSRKTLLPPPCPLTAGSKAESGFSDERNLNMCVSAQLTALEHFKWIYLMRLFFFMKF